MFTSVLSELCEVKIMAVVATYSQTMDTKANMNGFSNTNCGIYLKFLNEAQRSERSNWNYSILLTSKLGCNKHYKFNSYNTIVAFFALLFEFSLNNVCSLLDTCTYCTSHIISVMQSALITVIKMFINHD